MRDFLPCGLRSDAFQNCVLSANFLFHFDEKSPILLASTVRNRVRATGGLVGVYATYATRRPTRLHHSNPIYTHIETRRGEPAGRPPTHSPNPAPSVTPSRSAVLAVCVYATYAHPL